MGKVTSKLQVTLPKVIAERFGIKPGDTIVWEAAGDVIRVIPATKEQKPAMDLPRRLRLFDQATARQRKRKGTRTLPSRAKPTRPARGWTRAELYRRGSAG